MKRWAHIVLAVAFILRFASCGGGGPEGVSVLDGRVVTWAPPVSYIDSTPLDPTEELDVYELYVNETGFFYEYDYPVAYISAIDENGFPNWTFDLGKLDYPFSAGKTYYISMRSVTKSNVKSDFSDIYPYTIPVFIVEG